jgi:hypothetical protein
MPKVKVKTYDPRKVILTWGAHVVTGYADDSFVNVEAAGEGITTVVGCDGEVARSMDPNKTSTVKITLMQTSSSNQYFNKMHKLDDISGAVLLPMIITDLRGQVLFSAQEAWINKQAPITYGKQTGSREWEFSTGDSEFTEN